MGLFDKLTGGTSSNKEQVENKPFDPIIIDTSDVSKELKNVAASQNVPIGRIDFKLLQITTQYKTKEMTEWEELDEKKLKLLEDNTFFVNPDLQIEQSFRIEIFDVNDESKQKPALPDIVLGANKKLTKVVVTVKKNLDISYTSTFEQDLFEAINKKKIMTNILVGFRDKGMKSEVKKIASLVRVNGIIETDQTFLVMEGIDPVLPVNDAMIFHYKKKVKAQDDQGRVDYSRRGYLLAVDKGETIIEYIKPQEGSAGKTCRGNYIPVKEPSTDNDILINTTEAIVKKEDDKSIRYVAMRSGYVKEDGTNFDIQEQMEVSEVSFKTTGSIEAGLDTNVTINIKEDDVFKDAVGEGMNVETSELNVDGNVGNNASITAKKVWIGGQTHKTSKINTEIGEIAVHRGTLEAKEAKIERLEGGKVFADTVHIKSVIGGEIVAKKIYIEELASNASIITSELIEIKQLKGQNNKFLIDPSRIKGFQSEIKSLKTRIKDTEKLMDAIPKQLQNKKTVIDRNKNTIEMVRTKIAELKEDGVTPPSNLMGRLKEYQQLVNEYNTLLKTMKDYQYQINDHKEELAQVQNKIFDAKIINHSPWREYNEIKFKLISPPIEIIHNTTEHELSKEITLKQITDDKFEVQRSSEHTS